MIQAHADATQSPGGHNPILPLAHDYVDLTQAEQDYQHSLVIMTLIVALVVTPLIGVGYLAGYLFVAPVWSTLVLALLLFSFVPISLISLWLLHRKKIGPAVRVLLSLMLLTSGCITALAPESLILIGILVGVVVALLALFLEPSPVALRWVIATAVPHLLALAIRNTIPLPPVELGSIELAFLYGAPLCLFLTIAILGRSTIQFMRQALSESETLRAETQQAYKDARQATKAAVEANRLKSEFLSMMSHELRTPLNAIIGFTGIMLGGMAGKLDDEAVHMMKRIQSNGLHLLDLINNVLDLAKVEAHQFQAIYEPFAPRELIQQRFDQMHGLINGKEFRCEIAIDPALPEMLIGDKEIIQRIITNLLSNAFKFTDSGFVRLTASLNEDRARWSISVADTGIGIPPQALEYIFEPFRQVDGSSSRQFGGTGLGLAIVKQLVDEVHGCIRVDSTESKGSTFTVELPLLKVEQLAPEVVTQ